MNQYTGNKVQFGLAIPQGWRGGDLSLQQENDPDRTDSDLQFVS